MAGKINTVHSGDEKRCEIWVKVQNVLKSGSNVAEEYPENVEDSVAQSESSLAFLKAAKQKPKENVYFLCEWKECIQQFESEDHFYIHIVKHVAETRRSNEIYRCKWDLCYFDSECYSEITRHIYYHAYHTTLKTFGENINQRGNMPKCAGDSRNRNSVPDLKQDFRCLWDNCDKQFKSIFLYHKHVKLHCSFDRDMQGYDKSEPFSCKWDGCYSQFTVIYRLFEHVRKHSNEKVVGCSHCGAVFRSNTTFFNHCKRQLANNTQEYQCAECLKYFASEQLLRKHVAGHVNCLKCTSCNMTCNNMYSLSRHIRYRHLDERPFKCLQCGRGFVCKADLHKHTERVHQKKLYACEETGCGFTCKTIFHLKKHDTEYHGNGPAIYACHCCEKVYREGKNLSKHLIKVHGFQLPPGHSRFRYRIDEHGFHRLQTMRIESLEVTKQILSPSKASAQDEAKIQSNDEDSNSTVIWNSDRNTTVTIDDKNKKVNLINIVYSNSEN